MGNTSPAAVSSVADLDLARYLGLWFEIGRLPLRFEDEDARDITAEYSLQDDGTVRVDNRCRTPKHDAERALGQAVPDQQHPGRLRVSFLPPALRWVPFTRADYWVLKIDADYRYALVGTPDRKYLWLLARDPVVTANVETQYLASARQQGFDLEAWIRPVQSGQRVTDAQLDA